MVLCKFDQQGFCLLGINCHNDHVNVKETIKTDVDAAINGKQWPLSTYGPFWNKPSIPNFIKDQSFEEVRMMFYEATLKNLFGKFQKQLSNDILEARNKTKTLLQMTPDILDVAINLYNTTSDTSSSCVTVANTNNITNNPFRMGYSTSDDSGLGKSNAAYNKFGNNCTLNGTSWGASAISKAVNMFGGEINANKQECENLKNMNKNEISFLTNNKLPDDHVISKRIDKSIMDLILVDMLPYSVVEGVAFQRIQFADPIAQNQYRKKTEQFFRTSLMPETFNKVKVKVVAMLEAAKWISLTIDNWSYNKSSSSLLSFTAHFLVGSSRKKLVLWATVLENDHEDSYISEKFSEIITNYKLEKKIHLVVCDNVQYLEAAKKFGKLTSLQCVAHTMKQVINDVILNKKDIQSVITTGRSIVYHFKTSKQARKYFETIPESLAVKDQHLVLDDETKWSSTYLMMESLLEQKFNVNLYTITYGGTRRFIPSQWDLLNDFVEALACFYEAIIDLSAATVSLVIPLIYMLISKMNEDNGAVPMKKELKHALKENFRFIGTCPFLIVATYLDPRFKNKYLNGIQIQIAEKEMSEFLCQIEIASKSVEMKIEIEQNLNTKSGRKIKNSLWEKHDCMASFIETDISFRKELLLYIREPLQLRKSNIYEYWNSSPYENLKKVAVKYLSAPPFSDSGDQRLDTDKRAKLKGLNSEELFCHYNIQYLDFDY